jgi:hypothetical protein
MVAKHFSNRLRNITSSNSNKTNCNNRRGFNEEGTTAKLSCHAFVVISALLLLFARLQ